MILTLGFVALSALGTETTDLATGWVVRSNFGYCQAQQMSGADVGVRIVTTPASDDIHIVLFSAAPWGMRPSVDLENASVVLAPEVTYLTNAHAGPARSEATRFVSVLVVDPNFIQEFSSASTVSVSHPKLGQISVTLRSPASVVEALRKCDDEKMMQWGIDPVAWHALRRPPIPLSDFRLWIAPESYRLSALSNPNGQAVVQFTVEKDGTIEGCRGIDRSVPYQLSDAACAGVTKRGRFSPALDNQGNAVPAPYVIVAEFARIN
jgi:TonB family protein